MKLGNPFVFRPGPVSFWTTVSYLAVIIPLIYVQETVPPAPPPDALPQGVNLTEAWLDLEVITRSYHPFNSHSNDVVRDYLMRRSREILDRNGIDFTTDLTGGVPWESSYLSSAENPVLAAETSARRRGATLFDDRISNVTMTHPQPNSSMGRYFEGNNFYVYIRGSDDPEGEWWTSDNVQRIARSGAGVLVNCHFDSVSTGYGATDDGVGCISLLQLLSHFTSKGYQPKNGIVLLFNNAEEDGLLGAMAFGYSPLVQFCHTLVNLEGAGAGGRAMLFRATDLETAEAYSKSPHPFGSVVASNAFERRVIKSDTDYSVFVNNYGQRGLDIAFYSPRSRYHTEDDDARHTSVDSVWHMLSAALATTESLSRTTSTKFNGPRSDGRKDLVQSGRPTAGVWFDWYGDSWSAFSLRGLFAWSLALLITTPLILAVVTYLLVRNDKWYFFATRVDSTFGEGEGAMSLGGWKGFIRFPFALVVAAALTIGSVYLLAKVNPLIIYSSGYSVWAMMTSLFYFVSWMLLRGAHFVRPSALQRGFTLMWLFIITWILSIFAAVAEDRVKMGAVYPLAFLHTFVFAAVLISLLEQVALPTKQDFARQPSGENEEEGEEQQNLLGDDVRNDAEHNEGREEPDIAPDPTETTPLRTSEEGRGLGEQTTTFASTYRRSATDARDATHSGHNTKRGCPPYENEQAWSGRLPTWTWFMQLLLLVPLYVTVLGNLALVQTASVGMTGTDGSSLLLPLMGVGVLTILLLLPLTPFVHRVSHHVPLFLLLVFIGTLIYNLTAFPFSVNNRFKFYFKQVIDLDKGSNVVTLNGLEKFVRPIISSLPTPAGQGIHCDEDPALQNLRNCQYDGSLLPPDVAAGEKLENLVSIKASKLRDGRTIQVRLNAVNTRVCFIDTSSPIFGFSVDGGAKRDDRFGSFPPEGLQQIQLWRRDWEKGWNVTLYLGADVLPMKQDGNGVEGAEVNEADDGPSNGELKRRAAAAVDKAFSVTARCAWSDVNSAKTIPAFHEVKQFMPRWATVSKKSVGLVEVMKEVRVE
ncbi:Peptidase family M28 family [Metarhizium album ARSEF 1941]|uniref:Peptide hydrolase n=1 Tax=Metarhizium album (strain ARSEF 1941) TaxID=1081103 RepID=A0A0B2WTD6_METAS|nr:Peptidase family M28 family [Metarhizium album ARSEF 1941]KHN97273.1 Peptidase family M28 family [Metarhizium album ARSEF 1941]